MNFEDYETLPTSNITSHMMAGAMAGILEHCVMYPLDSVKVGLYFTLFSFFLKIIYTRSGCVLFTCKTFLCMRCVFYIGYRL